MFYWFDDDESSHSKMAEIVKMLAREAWSMSKVFLTLLDPLKGVRKETPYLSSKVTQSDRRRFAQWLGET